MATSFTARVSTSPRGWRAWRTPAGSTSAARCATTFEDLGDHEVKNTAPPVRAFRVVLDKPAPPPASPARKKAAAPPEKAAVAVLPFQNLGGDAGTEVLLDRGAE